MSIPSDRDELATLVTSLRRHLQRQERVGIRFLSMGEDLPKILLWRPNTCLAEPRDLFSDSSETYKAKTLEELRGAIGDCRRCKLWSGRTHLVFGVGNPKARLMFIGEGPGRDEDLQASLSWDGRGNCSPISLRKGWDSSARTSISPMW